MKKDKLPKPEKVKTKKIKSKKEKKPSRLEKAIAEGIAESMKILTSLFAGGTCSTVEKPSNDSENPSKGEK